MSWDYWNDLGKDFERLRFEIDGIRTDFTQASNSLSYFVKNHFPMNDVPKNIVGHLNHLEIVLKMAEKAYDICLDNLVGECAHRMEEINGRLDKPKSNTTTPG